MVLWQNRPDHRHGLQSIPLNWHGWLHSEYSVRIDFPASFALTIVKLPAATHDDSHPLNTTDAQLCPADRTVLFEIIRGICRDWNPLTAYASITVGGTGLFADSGFC